MCFTNLRSWDLHLDVNRMRSLLCWADEDDLRGFPPSLIPLIKWAPPSSLEEGASDLSASFACLLYLTTSVSLLSNIADAKSANVTMSGGFSIDPIGWRALTFFHDCLKMRSWSSVDDVSNSMGGRSFSGGCSPAALRLIVLVGRLLDSFSAPNFTAWYSHYVSVVLWIFIHKDC